MKNILDKMFKNQWLAILVPMLTASVLYLLFLFFGTAEDKKELLIVAPITCVFWFFGIFLVVYAQVKNPWCPPSFLDTFEFFSMIIFGRRSLGKIISFVGSGFENFDFFTCALVITYSDLLGHTAKEPNDIFALKNNLFIANIRKSLA